MRRPHRRLCSFGSNKESKNSGYRSGKATHEGQQVLKGRGASVSYCSPVGDWGGKDDRRGATTAAKDLEALFGIPCPPDSANLRIMADAQQEIIF